MTKRVLVAAPRSFCAGVVRAIDIADEQEHASTIRDDVRRLAGLLEDVVEARGGFDVLAHEIDPVRGELESHGGRVEKFVGDAVMGVFGAPVTYGDDAERAVRAAFAVRDWAENEGLQLRVAVNTGEAIVALDASQAANPRNRMPPGHGATSWTIVLPPDRLKRVRPVPPAATA